MILDIHLKGRLDRIVFDEVHKLITVNFRTKVRESPEAQFISSVRLINSHVSPPSMISGFNQFMMFKYSIREINKKPKVRYEIRRLSDVSFRKRWSVKPP